MYKIYKHIYNHLYLYQGLAVVLLIVVFLFPTDTYAFVDKLGSSFINWVNRFQFWMLDQFILPLIEAAMTFDDFFNAGVKAGYNVVRDFANLLLGLLLLFIAIGTVLDFGPFSEYNIKSKLPNFIMSALLINYSLPLIALGIDISQIIMIEFYNAIVAGGSLADHLASFTDLSMVNRGSTESVVSESTIENIGGAVADSHIVLSLVIAAITAVINVVFLWLAAILVHRIAILMMLSMTAPLAFISNLFPPLKAFWSQWIKFLSSALTGGPILMFLIYLAMQVFAGASAATGDEFSILNFVLAIILLIIALQKSGEFTEGMPNVAKSAVTYAAGAATGGLGGYIAGKNSATGTGQTFNAAKNTASSALKKPGQARDMAEKANAYTQATFGRSQAISNLEMRKKKREQDIKEGKGGIGFGTGRIRQVLSESGRKNLNAQGIAKELTKLEEMQANGQTLSSEQTSKMNRLRGELGRSVSYYKNNDDEIKNMGDGEEAIDEFIDKLNNQQLDIAQKRAYMEKIAEKGMGDKLIEKAGAGKDEHGNTITNTGLLLRNASEKFGFSLNNKDEAGNDITVSNTNKDAMNSFLRTSGNNKGSAEYTQSIGKDDQKNNLANFNQYAGSGNPGNEALNPVYANLAKKDDVTKLSSLDDSLDVDQVFQQVIPNLSMDTLNDGSAEMWKKLDGSTKTHLLQYTPTLPNNPTQEQQRIYHKQTLFLNRIS